MGPPRISSEVKNCELSQDEVDRRQYDYTQILLKLKGAIVINPQDIFCKSGVCSPTSGDLVLYADIDHLSISGSKYQAEFLAPYLLGK